MILFNASRQAPLDTAQEADVYTVSHMGGLRGISNKHSLAVCETNLLSVTKAYITLFLWTIAQNTNAWSYTKSQDLVQH